MRGKRVVAILTVIMVVTSCVSESMPIYAEDFISEESETPEFFEDQDSFASAEAVSEDSITENGDGFVSQVESEQEEAGKENQEELILIDDKTFPDEQFRKYISSVIDENTDGKLSSEEISKTRELNISNQGISDLAGIEVFTNLKYLDGSRNHLAYVKLPDFLWNDTENVNEEPIIILDGQTVSVTAEKAEDNRWSISLADLVGAENVDKISDIECPVEMENDNGKLEVSIEVTAFPWVTYNYSIGNNVKELSMDVKININIKENVESGTANETNNCDAENTYEDFEYIFGNTGEVTITKYKGNQSNLVIPEEMDGYKVTGIGYMAFYGCEFLVDVEIPITMREIGDLAFSACNNLEKIKLTNGVEHLGYGFIGGSKVKSIKIPASVNSSGVSNSFACGALDSANNLEEVVFEEGIQYIPGNICWNNVENKSLKKVVFPESAQEIGEYAFRNCIGIEEIIFGKNIRKIDRWAFSGCAGLKKVIFQENEGIKEIGDEAFGGCTALEALELPEGIQYLGYGFIGGTQIKSIQIPSTIRSCGVSNGRREGALSGAAKLEEVIISDGTRYVPGNICCNYIENTSIKKIVIPESVKSIGENAFQNCAGIEEIIFGKNINEIGREAFRDCTGLKKVIFQESDETEKSSVSIGYNAFNGCTSLETITLSSNIGAIGDDAFLCCSNLEELELPEGITYLGYSFIGGTKIKSIKIPSTVTSCGVSNSMGYGALSYVTQLEEITFADGMEYVPGNICWNFAENTSLKKIVIPESVTEIGENAFRNCAGIEEITFGKNIRRINRNAFRECSGLKKIVFQENEKEIEVNGELRKYPVTIESGSFWYCGSLEAVILSSNVTEIGDYAFCGCNSLEELNLPEGVRHLGYEFIIGTKIKSLRVPSTVGSSGTNNSLDGGALNDADVEEVIFAEGTKYIPGNICWNRVESTSLKRIVIPESVKEIGERAFQNCSGIEKITFGKDIRKIGRSAFRGCNGLKRIEFQENEKEIEVSGEIRKYPVTIEEGGFWWCESLEEVVLSSNVTEIGNYAFCGCSSLEKINLPEGVEYLGYEFISGTKIKSLFIPSTVAASGTTNDLWGGSALGTTDSIEEVIFADGMEYIPAYICWNRDENTSLKKVIIPESVTEIGERAFDGCKNIIIYGYTDSYAETYATENNIPFVSLGESIGNCDYDYSSELDKWLLNKGTSNSFNYLVKETNFLCPVSVVANDADFAAGVTEAISNLTYRGLDGWKELANGATSRDQAREILVALLNAQSADVRGLAEEETGQKLSKLFVKTFQKGNWAYATAFGLDSTEINQLASICQEDKIADFFADDNYVSISGYLQIKGGFAEDSKVVKCIESFGASKEMMTTLSDELELWGNVLKIGSITEETINYIYNIKSLLAADEMYSEMLKYIQSNCPYIPVRDAAGDLYDVIHGGATEQIRYAARSIAEAVEEKAVDAALKFLMKSVPYGELINDTYHYAVDLSNMLFKTKDIQQQKDNMRCVAYASRYISRWMIDCRSKYLTGAAPEKSANARRTVYGYYMLLQIRISGEESFQKLMEITKKNNKRAYNVSKGIIETLESNKKWMKDSGVLDEMSTSIVACPVDVSIYDADGNCVYTLYDGAETSGYLNGIYYSVSHQPLEDDYIKIVRIPENSGYTLKCTANDLGTVDYSLLTISDDGEMQQQEIDNIPVDEGNVIRISDISGGDTKCSLEKNGETVKEYKPQIVSNEYVPVESLQAEITEVSLKVGEKSLLNVQILPENATEKQIVWSSSDEGIVTVNSDGVIVGKAVGSADVTAKVLNEEKTLTFNIRVVQENQADSSPTPSITPSATPSPTPSAAPSTTPSPTPSVVPSVTPSPSVAPSATPSPSPSVAPSVTPSLTPSAELSPAPSTAPSLTPSVAPSATPSPSPSQPGKCIHNWSTWEVVQKADVFNPEKQERTCTLCGEKEQKTVGEKLTPVIELNASAVVLKVKQSTSGLKVTKIAEGDSIVSWKSSNPKVVKVSKKGKLTAKKVGKATVTITLKSGGSKIIPVKVQKKAVKTTKITGLSSQMTLNKGTQKVLKPIRQPFTSVEKITYTSSNRKIVSVTSKGKLKALKAGTAKITVKAGKKKFVIKVTVPKKKK